MTAPVPTFDFDQFETNYLRKHSSTTAAVLKLIDSAKTNTNAQELLDRYLMALSVNEARLNDLVVGILTDHDNGLPQEAGQLLALLTNEQLLKPHFKDPHNEQALFVKTDALSPEAKHLLLSNAGYSTTNLLRNKDREPSSWTQSMIATCKDDQASCDFVLSKTFEAFNNKTEGDIFFRDNVFRAIEQSGSVALKSNYALLLKWMEKKDLSYAYIAHIPAHWHAFKTRAHDNDCAELSGYIKTLVKNGTTTPRYIEDEIDADDVLPVAVISAFEKGRRCKSDVPRNEILEHIVKDNKYYLYALAAQKVCERNSHIDFRSAYMSLDANKITSQMVGRLVLGRMDVADLKEFSTWEDRLELECKQKVEKGKSNFFKALLIAFPGVEALKFALKVNAGEQYGLVDGVSSAAMLTAWVAAVCFTEEGKSARKFLSAAAKDTTNLLIQKTQDIMHSIATKTEKGLSSMYSGLLKLVGRQVEPDITSDLEDQQVLPLAKRMIKDLNDKNQADPGYLRF